MHEILWFGRGGQGVVLASEILADAAFRDGYRGVTAAPTFGPERRGAPLTASTKIAEEPLRSFAQITEADIAVVLDESLFHVTDIPAHIKDGGTIIINSKRPVQEWSVNGTAVIATVDATAIAAEHRLSIRGTPIVNTTLLGAFTGVSDIVSFSSIVSALQGKMKNNAARDNAAAAEAARGRVAVTRR